MKNVIALFNHKGGVSKTTTTFNLGWKLAEKGYKVLLIDADPQCNLTAMILGFNRMSENIEQIYANKHDIYSALTPVIDSNLEKLKPIEPIKTSNENLDLILGNIKLAEVETQISVAFTTSESIKALRNIPGSFRGFLKEMNKKYNYDFILIDMNPSVGDLNKAIFFSSDYFIIPTFPDFFSAEAIKSIIRIIPQWYNDTKNFRNSDLIYYFEDPPKFLGFISQNFRPRKGNPAKAFNEWINKLKGLIEGELYPTLKKYKMTLDEECYNQYTNHFELAAIPDFNSLIAISQEHNLPVFALEEKHINRSGAVLKTMLQNKEKFNNIFENLATSVINLVTNC